MKRTISLVLVLALGLASVSLASEGIWTTKAPMPTARWILSTSVVDGKIYAIGGGPSYLGEPFRTVEEYDPATDTWTTKSEMPTARQGLSTSVVNGKIYAMGGGDISGGASATRAFSTVEEYDPATNTWTTKSEMPTARFGHSANVLDGRIYVIGGGPSCPWCGAILTLEVYEPATDNWIRKADIPRRIITASTNVVDGKIYAMGGEGTGRRVDEYDPVTDTWTRKADMPSYRTDLSSSVVDGKIYAIGGDGDVIVATVEVYDPTTNTWTTAPDMPTARTGLRTSVVNGKIYAIGGLASWGGTAYGTVEEYAPPIVVDFNGDGIVDALDICIMADHWHTDYQLCDIGPTPLGDGIVDVQDLIVLAEHLFTYPGAVAYWKLDDTEGEIAYDSVGVYDGILNGVPTWQPTSGMIDGALELDGIDDYVSTEFVLNPADGPFSVFAWVKGGAPGQVILSQESGVNWLMADAVDGALKTDLRTPAWPGRIPIPPGPPLICPTVVTDGDWHRVGFVSDGSDRILYVDDIEVASDTATNLESASGGLYIGAGSDLVEPGVFWSGLIDDVRIYNRAVTP